MDKKYTYSDLIAYFSDRPDVQSALEEAKKLPRFVDHTPMDTLSDKLRRAFAWIQSEQGGGYWVAIHDELVEA